MDKKDSFWKIQTRESFVITRAYTRISLSLDLNAPENSYKYTYTRFYSSCEFPALESLRPSR